MNRKNKSTIGYIYVAVITGAIAVNTLCSVKSLEYFTNTHNNNEDNHTSLPISVSAYDISSLSGISEHSSVQEIATEFMELPDLNTSFKSYMSYRCITNTSSEQYKLQSEAWTDDNGLRRLGDDYMVALGSYYSSNIGDRFIITLDTDAQFTAVMADMKADKHTDNTNRYSAVYDSDGNFISANVIEFIVDTNELPQKVKLWGDVSAIDDFSGNIVSIEKIIEGRTDDINVMANKISEGSCSNDG